ncbi:hypothetical protein [Loktanella sp. M215]|uniref:hypothetical protein n=1 Tax=Loktanella sp. M215 TaxID=2675431 RepID=UPI001F38250D|nr:hypothetical protein [Loktanella sp. M215]MCF7700552.1 hypothetical protein [Loktanella sp. M215]
MLRLRLNRAPTWIDLAGGVRVEVVPPSSRLMLEVRETIDLGDGEADIGNAAFVLAYGKALAVAAITDWEGVVGEDDQPAPVTPQNVAALMDIYQCYLAFRDAYITPALTLAAEGNVSAPSPNGTSAAAPATVPDATASAKSAQAAPSNR